jgi:hypothetical protein
MILKDEVIKYIKDYGGNLAILTSSEIRTIQLYNQQGKLEHIEFNKKGHLIIEQRYPYLPLYISLLALVVSLISYVFIFVSM